MAVQETNLRAVLTLIDEMSPVLKSVQKELRAASRDIQDGFKGIKDMALTAGAGITALAGAGAGVWFATTAAAETATQMDMMSRQTGVATERLQAWQAVAVQSGMEGEEFAEHRFGKAVDGRDPVAHRDDGPDRAVDVLRFALLDFLHEKGSHFARVHAHS